jgi:ATP-dependent Clp endopeptidase proteolytic subunit ClpP
MKLSKKEKKEEESKEEEGQDQEAVDEITFLDPSLLAKPTPRIISVYGEIEEEKCGDAVLALEILKEDTRTSDDGEEVVDPIKFYLSTFGGSAVDMFAVYDAMRMAREKCEIHTYAMGKVMSAGVLLLAAGTKGQRRIGANCRVMLHSVLAGHHGSLANLENEVQEVKFTQKLWSKALLKETDMSEAYLKRLMRKNVNVYFDAEKAVELGIADIIV